MARRTRSRKLRFVLIVIALLVGGSACSSATRQDGDADVVDADNVVDADRQADADRQVDADRQADADRQPEDADIPLTTCEDWEALWEEEVTIEDSGVTATTEAICASAVEPVESNRAALVTLNAYSEDLHLAAGRIELAEAIRDQLVGTPAIEIVATYPDDLAGTVISAPEPAGSGVFTFQLTFPEGASLYTGGFGYPDGEVVSVTALVSLTLRCDDSGAVTRVVESTTHIWLCDTLDHPNWYSSGETCSICWDIAEMAPSPIVPEACHEGTALSRPLSLRIEPVASFGRTLCVVAEHSGAQGPVRYRWTTSAGDLLEDDQGGALWEIPQEAGPHLIQVAISDRDSAAVASLRFAHGA